jgi:hypothetical protein
MKINRIKRQRQIFAQALVHTWRSGAERKGLSSTPTFFDSHLPRLGTQHPRCRVWRSNGSPGSILLGFGDPMGHPGVHYGWSELAATSCGWARWGRFPDERKSHPPCPDFFFFFHLFSTPKFSPVLPTTYLPPPTYHLPTPPPSLHRQSSWLQRRWAGASLELGAGLERERAWSLERLEPDPRRTHVNIFFKSQCSFFLPR